MASPVHDFEQYYDEEIVSADETGGLKEIAAILDEASPSLLFLSTANGHVIAAHDVGSGTALSSARGLAQEMATQADHSILRVWKTLVGRQAFHAFAMRLGDEAENAIFGGLLATPVVPIGLLQQRAAVLLACARLAWRGTQFAETIGQLQTRVCHLVSQHDTLRAAHTEALNQAIEEHSRRLREEQEHVATQQMCAATEAANKAKSAFLANMSHEIRTPMTAILGFAEMLLGEPGIDRAPPERIEVIQTIQRNGQYLLELINDILDLSKIEAGKLDVERVACSPMHVLSDVIDLMRIRADAKNLAMEVECVGSVPESIQCDPLRLRQVLINLLGNAIKFTETGGVRVVVRLIHTCDRPARLQFDVVDTGIGLSAEQIAKLFRPFHQADSSTTRRFGGTGLGLTISKRLVEILGGDITVSSVPDEGSTFSVTIETGDLEGVKLLEASVAGTVPSATVSPEAATAAMQLGCRILLAEDGPDNQRLISFLLKKAGAEVTPVENGQLAVEAALVAREAGRAFDVILMDMQMPVMDGYTATKRLREQGYTGPIIALTAHAMAEDRQKCLDTGCNDYATKPIDRQKLLATIADWLVRTGSSE